jgi:hypothetical protein
MVLLFTLLFSISGFAVVAYSQIAEQIGADNDELVAYIRVWVLENYGQEMLDRMDNIERSRAIADAIDANLEIGRDGRRMDFDFMGDMYFDGAGNLVIQIVESAGFSRGDIENMLLHGMEADGVQIEFVQFSQQEIRVVLDVIFDYMDHNWSDQTGWGEMFFSTAFHDVKNNRVVVEISGITDEKIARFRRDVIDSPMLYFIECTGMSIGLSNPNVPPIMFGGGVDSIENDQTDEIDVNYYDMSLGRNIRTLHPGDGVASMFSMGYAVICRSTGQQGFIISGHNTGLGNAPGYGRVAMNQVSGFVDAALVLRTSTAYPQPINVLRAGNVLRQTVFPRVGDTVIRVGARTGLAMGTIEILEHRTDQYLWLNNNLARRQLTVTRVTGMHVGQGDSGGIVMHANGNILGITQGMPREGAFQSGGIYFHNSVTFFIPAHHINFAFNVRAAYQ